jgi:hypothetical protein
MVNGELLAIIELYTYTTPYSSRKYRFLYFFMPFCLLYLACSGWPAAFQAALTPR